MLRKCTLSLCALALFSGGAFSATLFGSKGRFSTLLSQLEYDPSQACRKPYKPYSDDRFAREQYRNDALRYADCLKNATSDDAAYASQVVSEGYEKAIDEFVSELREGY